MYFALLLIYEGIRGANRGKEPFINNINLRTRHEHFRHTPSADGKNDLRFGLSHVSRQSREKGRTKEELHQVITWLTGFDDQMLQELIRKGNV